MPNGCSKSDNLHTLKVPSLFNIFITLLNLEMSEFKEITKTFLSGKLSSTLVIPIEIARRYGLEKPAHVIIEKRPDGILIRRLTI
jgi:hypothetical protein